jgi:hypothetical protein
VYQTPAAKPQQAIPSSYMQPNIVAKQPVSQRDKSDLLSNGMFDMKEYEKKVVALKKEEAPKEIAKPRPQSNIGNYNRPQVVLHPDIAKKP